MTGYALWIDGEVWMWVRGEVFGQETAVAFTEEGARFWPSRAFKKKLASLGECAWVGRIV